jgi:hypothetical protein
VGWRLRKEKIHFRRAWSVLFIDVSFLLSVALIAIIFALTATTEFHWVAHAIAGVISLLFSLATVIVGAMLGGRIKRRKGANLFRLHRKASSFLTILVLSAFFSGLWGRASHGEPLFWQHVYPLAPVVQGWSGLVVTIISIAQVIPCFAGKRKNRKLHMILGYALLVALVIQIFLGVETALIEMAGG